MVWAVVLKLVVALMYSYFIIVSNVSKVGLTPTEETEETDRTSPKASFYHFT
jgi:hypothetical protein